MLLVDLARPMEFLGVKEEAIFGVYGLFVLAPSSTAVAAHIPKSSGRQLALLGRNNKPHKISNASLAECTPVNRGHSISLFSITLAM